MDAVANTSLWMAAIRAQESERPDRLFSDPLAHALAGEDGLRILSGDPLLGNAVNYVTIRTRYFDDFVLRVAEGGMRQVVLVAAGLDARAFRIPWPEGVVLFEVDQPSVLDYKQSILEQHGAAPRCRRSTIGINLESDWVAPLIAAGFQPAEPALWLVEGLFVYLEMSAVRGILGMLSSVAAPGSKLATDFISESFLTSPWTAEFHVAMAARGLAWRSATDEPEELLKEFGWEAEVRQPGEPGLNPERWPFPVMQRIFRSVPRSFLVTATKSHG